MPCPVEADLNYYLDQQDDADRFESAFEDYFEDKLDGGKTLVKMTSAELIAFYSEKVGSEKIAPIVAKIQAEFPNECISDLDEWLLDEFVDEFSDFEILCEDSMRESFENYYLRSFECDDRDEEDYYN